MTTQRSEPSADGPQAALFDADLASWRGHPERAFDGWLARNGFRHGTSVVYRAMWGKLLRWSAERGLAPLSWSAGQIGEFLDEQDLHKSHRYRYTRLIERIYNHLARLQEGLHNPASQAVRTHLAEGENDPTAFLLPGERDLLIARVLGPAGAAAPDGAGASPTEWKRARDAALVAVLLGAGLKVGEVRALRTTAIDSSRSGRVVLRMAKPETGRTYETPLFAFAHRTLMVWLALREASGTLGELVFPAMPNGRAMHAASIYRRVELLLDQAGVLSARSERASPQTLRNTCGAMHFEAGASPATVAQWLGMRDFESGWRLRAAHEAWADRAGLAPPGAGASG